MTCPFYFTAEIFVVTWLLQIYPVPLPADFSFNGIHPPPSSPPSSEAELLCVAVAPVVNKLLNALFDLYLAFVFPARIKRAHSNTSNLSKEYCALKRASASVLPLGGLKSTVDDCPVVTAGSRHSRGRQLSSSMVRSSIHYRWYLLQTLFCRSSPSNQGGWGEGK